MLGLRRRPIKTHAQLVKNELSESIDHLVQAANHAAGGVGATVGPRVDAARERMGPAAGRMKTVAATGLGTTAAALAPLAMAAKEGARKARRKAPEPAPRRWPRIALLLAAGTAVGAAAALVLRRRRQEQWEEYDPSRPLESSTSTPAGESISSIGMTEAGQHRSTRSTATTAEEMADKASSAIDSARSRAAGGESTVPVGGISTPVPGPGIANPVTGLETPSGNSRSY